MAIARYTLLFDFTTNPTNRQDASSHSGGWSESNWGTTSTVPASIMRPTAERRANLLADSCSIIGYRYEEFTISGNRLIPGGASSGRFLYAGSQPSINMPQDALMCNGIAVGAPNTNRFTLRGLPDSVVTAGEYSPTNGFRLALSAYFAFLSGVGAFGFVGRIRTTPNARVMSIAAGVVTLDANIGGAADSFIRFLRVRDSVGNPVSGSFRITNVAGAVYTVSGLGGTSVVTPSGLARIDAIQLFAYSGFNDRPRTAVRKVGRPFEVYRGRASRRR